MGYKGPLRGKNFASTPVGMLGGGAPMPIGGMPSGGMPNPVASLQGSAPPTAQPAQAPTSIDAGSGGGLSNPFAMLQQDTTASSTAQAPAPAPDPGSPQQEAMLPDPTIFDIGQQAYADPALGKRNPAFEGLLDSFRKRNVY